MADRACHCTDFSRTELFRLAAAEAGRGLPAIEAGMPLPAGTGLDRRTFLTGAAGVFLSVYGAGRLGLPAFEEGVAQAATGSPAPVLVSVFLAGGADSLSILFPAGDPRYRELRPRVHLAEQDGLAFPEDPRLRWHPSAAAFATLHAEGKLSVLPAVGYSDAHQSHFTSRHFWEVGETSARLRTGWLGRYLDLVGAPDNPLQGLSLDGRLAPTLATAVAPVASIDGASSYRFRAPGVSGQVDTRMLEALYTLAAVQTNPDAAVRQTVAATVQADQLRRQLAPFAASFAPPVPYPADDGFPGRLAGLAAMLAAGLPLRCVALKAPGMYDTHANQLRALSENLRLTADSLLAFQRDLEARGLSDRVLVHVWSEFGRRVAENGSLGTDHGAAGIGLLIGARVRGRMIGEFPGLAHGVDSEGNIRATADYRSLYCALLEQWLGVDAGAVIPSAGRFTRPALLK